MKRSRPLSHDSDEALEAVACAFAGPHALSPPLDLARKFIADLRAQGFVVVPAGKADDPVVAERDRYKAALHDVLGRVTPTMPSPRNPLRDSIRERVENALHGGDDA
jgi:hypothetical protein